MLMTMRYTNLRFIIIIIIIIIIIAPIKHSSSQKTRMNDLSCGHKFISFCHKSRI